jgi:uncharacterized YceG family protein
VNGGHGADGGRGSDGYGTGGGRGPGDRQPGYRDSGFDDDSYGYGTPPGTGGYGVQGQSGQGGQRYGGRGPGRHPGQPGQQGSRPGPGPGAGQPRGQGPGQAPGRGQGYGQGYGQPGGRPDPWSQPQRPGTGSGPQQYPSGYDPRGAAPRRAADGYPPDGYQSRGDARYGREGYPGREPGQRDDSFLPGFGGPDEYDDRRAPRGRGGRYQDEAGAYDDEYDDRRAPRDQRDRRRRGGRRDDGGQPPRPRRGPVRRLAPWIALLVILTPLVVGGVYGYNLYENKYHPADYSGPGTSPTVTVQVNSGDNAFTLGPRLVQLGVVASARAFELAAEHSTSTTGLEVGFYRLNRHMQASLAYADLLNPKDRVQLTVTIPEGKRTSQVVALLAKETGIPLGNFQQVINNPAQLGLPSYAKGKVEGYLFPATYNIQPNETALQILQAMVRRYGVEAQQVNLAAAAAKVGLTPEQVIIEASMAQAEGGSVSDYKKIARVIINRLHDGMKLQFDSVLLYGLNAYGINVTDAQIATPGPYNDFQHAGLPPTPICNPGDAAIQGILHPASGPWLYFLTNTGGKSTFSATPLQGQ